MLKILTPEAVREARGAAAVLCSTAMEGLRHGEGARRGRVASKGVVA